MVRPSGIPLPAHSHLIPAGAIAALVVVVARVLQRVLDRRLPLPLDEFGAAGEP